MNGAKWIFMEIITFTVTHKRTATFVIRIDFGT